MQGDTAELVLQYLLGLCVRYPILLPLLEILFNQMSFENGFPYREQVINILDENSINFRSDAMAWSLYYLNKYSQPIPVETAERVLCSRDCVAILFIYLSKQFDEQTIDFCNNLDRSDLYLLDQYWLLLYQLFIDGKIPNPYEQDENAYNNHRIRKETSKDTLKREVQVFNILKSEKVSFVNIT